MSVVEVITAGPALAVARSFKIDGRLHVCGIVKTRLSMSPTETMRATVPPTIEAGDTVDAATGVGLLADEMVPYRPGADITFVGSAHTPSAVTRTTVRLAILQPKKLGGDIDGADALVQKTLDVVGPRIATRDWPDVPPAQFSSLPMSYALSFGGIDYPPNPAGTGHESSSDARRQTRLPSIAYPSGVRPIFEPVGFGPIPTSWSLRSGQIPDATLARLEHPCPELSSKMDFKYFHAAPLDQRTPFLRGDEWIYLERLYPGIERFMVQLPRLVPIGLARLPKGAEQPVSMHIDTLAIDGERGFCDVVARGSFAVRSEDDLRWVKLVLGFETRGFETRGFETRGAQVPAALPSASPVVVKPVPARRPQVRPSSSSSVVAVQATRKPRLTRDSTLIMEPPAAARSQDEAPESRQASTVQLEPEVAQRLIQEAIAKRDAANARRASTVVMEVESPAIADDPTTQVSAPHDLEETAVTLMPSALARMKKTEASPFSTRAPFRLAEPRAKPTSEPPREATPGAPWDKGPKANVKPAGEMDTMQTYQPGANDDEELKALIAKENAERARAAAAAPTAAPHARTAEPQTAEQRTAEPWRNVPEEEPAPVVRPKPVAPTRQVSPIMKKSLYQRFKK